MIGLFWKRIRVNGETWRWRTGFGHYPVAILDPQRGQFYPTPEHLTRVGGLLRYIEFVQGLRP